MPPDYKEREGGKKGEKEREREREGREGDGQGGRLVCTRIACCAVVRWWVWPH